MVIFAVSASILGCLYVAPIEEEPPAKDELPYIHAVSPGLGVIEIDLSWGEKKTFSLSSYGDENEEQELYHRIVMDFRAGGATGSSIYASHPLSILPDQRDSVSYQFDPCAMTSGYGGSISDGKTMDMYILLSDEPFIHDSQSFVGTDFLLPFKTQTDRGAVYEQWTVVFKGNCS